MAAAERPLTVGEILDRTVQLYRRNFLLFTGISILPSTIYVALSGGATTYFTSKIPALQQPASATPQAMIGFFLLALAFLAIGLPILLATAAIAMSASNYAAYRTQRGENATIRAAFGYSFERFWRQIGIFFLQVLFAGIVPGAVFGVLVVIGSVSTVLIAGADASAKTAIALLVGILMIVGLIALMVVCVWIWLRFCLAFPAAISEETKAWPSLKRSNFLSKGSRGRIFVMYLMVFVLTMVVYYAVTLPIDIVLKFTLYKSVSGMALLTKPPLGLQIVNLLVSCLERAFVLPIYAISLLLFYNDQRTRLEGFDIEQLMEHAGWPAMPVAAPPASSQPYGSPSASNARSPNSSGTLPQTASEPASMHPLQQASEDTGA